jgi:hypothetical protein
MERRIGLDGIRFDSLLDWPFRHSATCRLWEGNIDNNVPRTLFSYTFSLCSPSGRLALAYSFSFALTGRRFCFYILLLSQPTVVDSASSLSPVRKHYPACLPQGLKTVPIKPTIAVTLHLRSQRVLSKEESFPKSVVSRSGEQSRLMPRKIPWSGNRIWGELCHQSLHRTYVVRP